MCTEDSYIPEDCSAEQAELLESPDRQAAEVSGIPRFADTAGRFAGPPFILSQLGWATAEG